LTTGIQRRHLADFLGNWPESYDDSHQSQWTRMMWSLKKRGSVYLPKKSISNIDPESFPSSRSSAGIDEYLIPRLNRKFNLELFLGAGIAESRNPQATNPHPPTPIIVDKTKNKQGTFPWLVNLAGPPGIPGN
jgi:hypothetical protein